MAGPVGVVPVPLPAFPPVGAAPPGTWVDEQTVTYTVSGSPTAPVEVGSVGASVEAVGASVAEGSVEDGSTGALVEEGAAAEEDEPPETSSAGGLAQRALVAERVAIWSAASQAFETQPMAAAVISFWFSAVHWQENSFSPHLVALVVASRMHWTCRRGCGLAGARHGPN